jgi:hypothetical protein
MNFLDEIKFIPKTKFQHKLYMFLIIYMQLWELHKSRIYKKFYIEEILIIYNSLQLEYYSVLNNLNKTLLNTNISKIEPLCLTLDDISFNYETNLVKYMEFIKMSIESIINKIDYVYNLLGNTSKKINFKSFNIDKNNINKTLDEIFSLSGGSGGSKNLGNYINYSYYNLINDEFINILPKDKQNIINKINISFIFSS